MICKGDEPCNCSRCRAREPRPSKVKHEFLGQVRTGLCHLCLMPKNHADHAEEMKQKWQASKR